MFFVSFISFARLNLGCDIVFLLFRLFFYHLSISVCSDFLCHFTFLTSVFSSFFLPSLSFSLSLWRCDDLALSFYLSIPFIHKRIFAYRENSFSTFIQLFFPLLNSVFSLLTDSDVYLELNEI